MCTNDAGRNGSAICIVAPSRDAPEVKEGELEGKIRDRSWLARVAMFSRAASSFPPEIIQKEGWGVVGRENGI